MNDTDSNSKPGADAPASATGNAASASAARSSAAQAEGSATPAAGQAVMANPEQSAEQRRRAVSRWLGVGLVLAVIVIVALAATLRHQQQQLNDFGREASRRLDEAASHAQLARQQAQLAQQTAQGLERRVTEVEARASQTASEQQALEHAWNELVVGEETSILVDVEQSLLLAAEQLQLAGRVPSAIAALQLAESRLARSGRPAYRSAQQAIARDLKRLQSLPFHDFSLVSEQIDRMILDIARFPLVAPGLGDTAGVELGVPVAPEALSPAAGPALPSSGPEPEAPSAEWWQEAFDASQAWASRTRDAALTELRRLVEVRRVDAPDAIMLSAEQADILRANLALRLLEARVALLSRVNNLWLTDLAAVQQAVQRYGETSSPITRRLLQDLESLHEVEPAPELPGLNDSLRAVRALLAGIESEPVPPPAVPDEVPPAGTPPDAAGSTAPGHNPEASGVPGVAQDAAKPPATQAAAPAPSRSLAFAPAALRTEA